MQSKGLPQPGSIREYNTVDLVEGFICNVILGSNRLALIEMIRTDEVICEIFGWERGMAVQSRYSRFLSSIVLR